MSLVNRKRMYLTSIGASPDLSNPQPQTGAGEEYVLFAGYNVVRLLKQ